MTGKYNFSFPGNIILLCNDMTGCKWNRYLDIHKKICVIPFETHFKYTSEKINLDNLIDEFRTYIQNVYSPSMDLTPPEIIQKETQNNFQ
jgi:hypothetical protein